MKRQFERLNHFFSASKLRRAFKTLALIALVASIPLTVVLVQQQQTIQQQAAVSSLKVSVNLRGAAHYGFGDMLPFSRTSDVDADLSEVRRMGGSVVRVYVGNNRISDATAAQRLGAFLD